MAFIKIYNEFMSIKYFPIIKVKIKLAFSAENTQNNETLNCLKGDDETCAICIWL